MRKKLFVFILIILTVLSFTLLVYSNTSNLACALVSSSVEGNQTTVMNAAKEAYENAGYSCTALQDPSFIIMVSNMMSRVQFYSTHGNRTLIEFNDGGICIGNTQTINGKTFYGVNDRTWNHALLITMAACNSAGENDDESYDLESITARLAYNGAEMTVGWRTLYNAFSGVNWSQRYNQKLGEGYTPSEAIEYANSFIYINNNVKNTQLFYRNEIVPITNTSTAINLYNAEKENKEIDIKGLSKNSTIENINKILTDKYNDINLNDYEIEYSSGHEELNVVTNVISNKKNYIDYKFKIGDFYTDAGFTIVASNNKIHKIIDNNIDMEIQKELLTRKEDFHIKTDNENNLINMAKANLNNLQIDSSSIIYYYDIINDKKFAFIEIDVKETTNIKNVTETFNDKYYFKYEI